MALKKIDERLLRLQGLVANWNTMGRVPRIERDIVLEELRRLYDEVLDIACDVEENHENMAEESPALESAVAVNAESKDNDEAAVSEEVSVVFDDVLDIAALLGLSGDDSIEIAERTVEENRMQKTVVEERVEETPAPVVEESVVETPAVESAEVVVNPVVEESLAEEHEKMEKCVENVIQEAKPFERAKDGGLFDIDDIPVQTRTGRRMISLYNDPVRSNNVVDNTPKPVVESSTNVATPAPTPTPKPVVRVEPSIMEVENPPQRLGDVIAKNVTTLADKIAEEQPTAAFNRITEIRKAIGLNDKFLMIRDLFGGDANLYEDTITHLDQFEDLDECMIFIVENFRWNPDSEGAKLLVSLIERKLS